jgi:hypothetical protein
MKVQIGGNMNELATEKTMTVKEVAEALNVSERVIQKHAASMGLTKDGRKTALNELAVTEIKKTIQASGRNDLAHVCELKDATTELSTRGNHASRFPEGRMLGSFIYPGALEYGDCRFHRRFGRV